MKKPIDVKFVVVASIIIDDVEDEVKAMIDNDEMQSVDMLIEKNLTELL